MTVSYLELDLVMRGGSMALLLLLAAILFRDHRAALPARLALLLILGLACHLVAEVPRPLKPEGPLSWIAFACEDSMYGVFWLFCRTWFDDETRIGWRSLVVVALSIAYSMVNFFIGLYRGDIYPPTDVPMRIMWLMLTGLGLWVAWRGRANDLVEARRKLRTTFVWIVGLALITISASFSLAGELVAPGAFYGISAALELIVLLVAFAVCLGLLGLRQGDLFARAAGAQVDAAPVHDREFDALVEQLTAHMVENKPYRSDGLTIAALAAQIGVQEYRLRRLINRRLGYRNFAAFLNSYRLAEVKVALRDVEQRGVPILTIALDAGFGTLAPFNRAFRDAEGMTPSAYRKLAD